ncbi:hypothetical protein [Motiliproteus sediminis]|uniref:hypothetical protein n=1 Tax=Motiliproteus sediminis TaxID=1468178 RepID=UPI001AF00B69|nr:hypothetical protein [Motiliproteus sediminis]
MAVKKSSAPLILCAAAVVVMLIALVTSMVMAASIQPVGKSSAELQRVAEQLDSVASIRTILFSYAHQYGVTEANLQRALNAALGFLTLGAGLVAALSAALLAQIRRVEQLKRELQQLHEQRR